MKKILSALAVISLISSSAAFAQVIPGSITFEGASIGVPVFGGVGLLLLSLVMGSMAFRFFRKGGTGHMAAISALAVGSLVASLSGAQLVNKSWAAVPTGITNLAGETFPLFPGNYLIFKNLTNVPMTVVEIRDPECASLVVPNDAVVPRAVTFCAEELTLAESEECHLSVPVIKCSIK